MTEPIRIPPEEVRKKVTSGIALLVCGYDDEDKFREHHLEDSISFAAFQSKLPSLSKDQEIIFFCA